MKAKNPRGATTSTSQLAVDFNGLANNAKKAECPLETKARAEVIALARFRSGKTRDVLIADLLNSRVPR